jgi:hypothetical protein
LQISNPRLVGVFVDAKFGLGANHSVAIHSTKFSFRDGDVSFFEVGSFQCYGDEESVGDVVCSADDLKLSFASAVYLADVHVIAIGVKFGFQNLSYHDGGWDFSFDNFLYFNGFEDEVIGDIF